MSRLLLSLWLLGVALIAGSTLVALNTIFGWTSGPAKFERTYIAERRAIALGRGPAADGTVQANLDPPEDAVKDPASQPAVPLTANQPDEATGDPEAPASADQSAEEDEEKGIQVRVAQAANVRAGPSSSAARLSTVPEGTELRALAHDGGWIQVADASGSEGGWIYGKLLEPIEPTSTAPAGDAASPKGERARVADKAAAVRAGPSEEAAMLFGFPYGRELRVLSREAGFAEVVDLRSKETGWIAESALESADSAQRIASPQRKSRGAPYAALAPSGDVALPADETMREVWRERPRKKARQARRGSFFNRAIRRGLGGR